MARRKEKPSYNGGNQRKSDCDPRSTNKISKIAAFHDFMDQRYYQSFIDEDDDVKMGLEEVEEESSNVSLESNEIKRNEDRPVVGQSILSLPEPTIESMSKEKDDILNMAILSPANLHVPFSKTVDVNQSIESIEKSPDDTRQLPSGVLECSLGHDEEEILVKLKQARECSWVSWCIVDNDKKYRNCTITPYISSQMNEAYKKQFREETLQKFPSLKERLNVRKAFGILQRDSFGALFINSKGQIFFVENYFGTRSAVKDHREINENNQFETIIEAVIREIYEEIVIRVRSTGQVYNENDSRKYFDLDNCTYLEWKSKDRERRIGLFIVHIDEKKLKFKLYDYQENQACGWLDLDDILNHELTDGYDKYYTLRPFIEHLKKHPELLRKRN